VDSTRSALHCCRPRILVFIWRVSEEPQNELKWNSALSGPRCKLCTFRIQRNDVNSTFTTGNSLYVYHSVQGMSATIRPESSISGCYKKNMQNCSFASRFFVNDQRGTQNLFYAFISIHNSLHVSSTSSSSSGETNCINTASGSSLLPTCTHLGHQHRMTATRGCIDTICLS